MSTLITAMWSSTYGVVSSTLVTKLLALAIGDSIGSLKTSVMI